MNYKPYMYKAFDGNHFPDAWAGSSYTYGIDFNDFLESEEGTLKSVSWKLDKELSNIGSCNQNLAEFFDSEDPNIAYKVINTPYAGSYKITCTLHYLANNVLQHVAIPLVIKVY